MRQTVLVVDDDIGLVRLLKECLEAQGYEVLTGFDGQMAIQTARSKKPDLIVMDVNMPLTNGLKALKYLRGMSETQGIPVIILSGAPSNTVYPTLESSSRVCFLKKPVDLEHLESMVRQLLPNA